jgi:hypothetical protein
MLAGEDIQANVTVLRKVHDAKAAPPSSSEIRITGGNHGFQRIWP